MANTESTFADRLQRGRQLQAFIADFDPAFEPGQDEIMPVDFDTFLTELAALNKAVTDTEADWRTTAPERVQLIKDIKSRALRAMARVKSDRKWAVKLDAVKQTYDNLRGYRTPSVKNPPAEGTASARRSATTAQSCADIKNQADRFIASLKNLSGYDTGAAADLTIAKLTEQSEALATINKSIADLEAALSGARASRKNGYNGLLGLHERMMSIKEATKSQYGQASIQYGQVKGIRV